MHILSFIVKENINILKEILKYKFGNYIENANINTIKNNENKINE